MQNHEDKGESANEMQRETENSDWEDKDEGGEGALVRQCEELIIHIKREAGTGLGISIAGGKGSPPFKDNDEVLIILCDCVWNGTDYNDFKNTLYLLVYPELLRIVCYYSVFLVYSRSYLFAMNVCRVCLCREWLRVKLQLKQVLWLVTSFLL